MGILKPLEIAVAWILVMWHRALDAIGMPAESGVTWVLSIVGLVLVIRTLLIPLYVSQIRSQRKMQFAQPELAKIQKKYKGKKDPASRQKMQAETMEVYKEHGNPLSGCLPALAQMPIFFALFRVLSHLDDIAQGTKEAVGPLTQAVAQQAEASSFFGAQLSESFTSGDSIGTKVVAAVLTILMAASQWYSLNQMMRLNTPDSSLDNPMIKNQRLMLYIFPAVMLVSGFTFPIGVVLYWFVSNLWTTVQQSIVIHQMPAPGSEGERRLNERRAKKGLPPKGIDAEKAKADAEEAGKESAAPKKKQREQPKRTNRRER